MTEQTEKKHDLPTPGRTTVLGFVFNGEEFLIDSRVLNPSLSKSCPRDSRKDSIGHKGQGLVELVEAGISLMRREVPRVNSSWQQSSPGWRMAGS